MAFFRADLGPSQHETVAATAGANKRRSVESILIKICVGLSLMLILFSWFDVNLIVQKLVSIDTGFLVLACVLFAMQFLIACARWMLILGRQSCAVTPRTALSIFGTGTLANLFLVTSVAGMSVRAALLLRAGASLPGALASITAERIAATAGLALCGIAGVIFALPELQKLVGTWVSPVGAVVLMIGGFVIAMALLAYLTRFTWMRGFMATVWAAFAGPGQAVQMVGASAAIVLLGFAGMAALAKGMGLSIDLMFFLSVMPAVALISALPISFGGWGVREGAMVAGLSIYAVPPDSAMALSISYGLAGLLVALLLGASLALLGIRRSA